MLSLKRKCVIVVACAIIAVYTITSRVRTRAPMSRPEYKERMPVLPITAEEPPASSQRVVFETEVTTLQRKEDKTIEPKTNSLEWLGGAQKMDIVTQNKLRCKALDLGCFVPFEFPDSTYVEIKMSDGDNTILKERCLRQCYSKEYTLAGFNAKGRKCLCSKLITGFISYTKKGKWASDAMDASRKCRAEKSVRVYRKIRNCEEGISDNSMELDKVGCIAVPKQLNGMMIALTQQHVTVQQCILNCELRQFTYALPVLPQDACLCSDSYSLFGTADSMGKMMQTCGGKESKRVPVYRTVVDEKHCTPLRFFNPGQAPAILLASYYGSGNTWIRHLIEVSTGVYTGSVYRDWKLYEGGMLGEPNGITSGRTVAIKDHLFKLNIKSTYRTAILLLRNPYDATLAEWSRRATKNHTGVVDPEAFRSNGFKNYAQNRPEYWFGIAKNVLKFFDKVLVIYFEDLLTDAVTQMRRLVKFLPTGLVDSEGERLERRLMCMNLDLVGNFKRPPRKLDFDPFDAFVRNKFDKIIRDLDDLLLEYHQPPLPDSYFLPS